MSESNRQLSALMDRRRQYKSAEEFVQQEGIEAFLDFLASNPSVRGDKYKNSQMKVLPYSVGKWTSNYQG